MSKSAQVNLAEYTITEFTKIGKKPPLPENLPIEMTEKKAGVFVSIKKCGDLRGCIGTIAPTAENIAFEIMQNAVSACSQDPRFPPVTVDELLDLTISVDILFPAEKIENMSMLDVKKYGVIVTGGYRRGLLLPNLDGVDTVEQQVSIAMQKAGIYSAENISLERFEVVRYY